MALEGEADLHHAPAQKDEADGADQGKDKIGQVVHHAQRIAGGEGRDGKSSRSTARRLRRRKSRAAPFFQGAGHLRAYRSFGIFLQNKAIQGFSSEAFLQFKVYFYGFRKSSGSSSSKSSYWSGEKSISSAASFACV